LQTDRTLLWIDEDLLRIDVVGSVSKMSQACVFLMCVYKYQVELLMLIRSERGCLFVLWFFLV